MVKVRGTPFSSMMNMLVNAKSGSEMAAANGCTSASEQSGLKSVAGACLTLAQENLQA